MFDFSAWREVVHVGEWSGLSIGAIVGAAALAWYVPPLRKVAIAGALLVAAAYGGALHGDKVGRADVNAQWADARAAAIEAEKQRDALAEQQLEQKYQPVLSDLQKQSDDRKSRSDAYERQILALLSKTPAAAGACELGAAANRVRKLK